MPSPWVWCDLEHTPQVLFLEPIIRGLRDLGHDVRVTAKPQGQTVELAAARGIGAEPVGSGDFRGAGQKIVGNLGRSVALARWVRSQGPPSLLISSSRSASFTAWLLRIEARAMLDYEYAEQRTLRRCAGMWLPDLLRTADLQPATRRRASFYEGLKENLYLDTFSVDRNAVRDRLGITSGEYLVVARPAAEAAHYASDDSTRFWLETVRSLGEREHVRIIAMPRDDRQRVATRERLAGVARAEVLSEVVNGPELVAAADLVVGAGGTMNRESAVLGTPAWSTFCGPPPHIDEQLHTEGRLGWIRSDEELRSLLGGDLPQRHVPRGPFPEGLREILRDLGSVAGRGYDSGPPNAA